MNHSLADRILEMACTIQQIPAPTFSEKKRANYILKKFKQAGLADVRTDEAGNVLARIPGQGNALPLVVSAHLDTVFPIGVDLTLRNEQDLIFGPGIGDNSLGIAALFALAWTFLLTAEEKPVVNSGLPGDIWLVANVGEEGLGDLKGMRAVVNHFEDRVKAYLVLEGMALGQIYNRALGVQRYRITAKTNGGHSWVDFGQPSAIHELATLVTALTHLPVSDHPRTTYNVGIISGGTSVNTLASEAEMELDLRSEEKLTLQALVFQVENLVRAANVPGVKIVAESIGNRPVGQISGNHPLVRLAQQTLNTLGLQPNLTIGSTDANIPLSLGIPAICIGISRGAGAHTIGEFIQKSPIEKGISQVINLVQNIFLEL